MKRIYKAGLVALGLAAVSTAALSDSHVNFEKSIKARQSYMQLNSFYLGGIAGMVKGEAPYDAKAAQDLANNLVALTKMQTGAMWPAGSDSEAMPGKTRAMKVTWTTYPAVSEKQKVLITAAETMAKTAGDGVDALKGTIGGVGGGCKGCHEKFRKPKE